MTSLQAAHRLTTDHLTSNYRYTRGCTGAASHSRASRLRTRTPPAVRACMASCDTDMSDQGSCARARWDRVGHHGPACGPISIIPPVAASLPLECSAVRRGKQVYMGAACVPLHSFYSYIGSYVGSTWEYICPIYRYYNYHPCNYSCLGCRLCTCRHAYGCTALLECQLYAFIRGRPSLVP